MSGAQETQPAMSFWALKAAAAWKASSVKIIFTSDGCTPPATSMFSAK